MSSSPPQPSRTAAPADAAELLLAGITFSRHFALSAVADGPGFRLALRTAGLPGEMLDLAERLRIDAAFAARWQRQPTDDAALLHALMVELLPRRVPVPSSTSQRPPR